MKREPPPGRARASRERYAGRVRGEPSRFEKEQLRLALERDAEIVGGPSTWERRVSEANGRYERGMVRKALEVKGQK